MGGWGWFLTALAFGSPETSRAHRESPRYMSVSRAVMTPSRQSIGGGLENNLETHSPY
jgi:hypothetical protein